MIRTSHSSYPVSAATHPGMTGKNNEDRYAVSAYRLKKRSRVPVLLAVLTDGIGGHRAGEVAAEIAVERISQAVAASDGTRQWRRCARRSPRPARRFMPWRAAIPARQGMGTTCVCAWIIDQHLYAASVGDSRLYLIRQGDIQQLNTDHTWVQEAIDQGSLKPEQIKGHPNQHVIRRYIGSPNPPEVDFRLRLFQGSGELADRTEVNQGMLLKEGDRLVLTSDGLTDLVPEREILSVYLKSGLEEANQKMIELANQRGGHDNITVVAIEIPRRTLVERLATSNRLFIAAAIAAVILAVFLFVGIVVGFDWLNNRTRTTDTDCRGKHLPAHPGAAGDPADRNTGSGELPLILPRRRSS